ncbi:PRC and DUF2382 domain-containing protein [Streptomyces benahoarensis]|uniref:DUF2382 domain-containing protein n=1 Tax=Streptomyces benahoarensis TaxID=2595054 RepID=A0A553ZK49_9ACTN|nr:PRC and DUF2382 domain-containing protein [Streptomyces benahoarensis]TSB21945.1 DUF2382 domain-containing protein [Streptomyces benahoarensis]TSB41842.1 DUF2382 domain-containing protein [Streptomyces benahoarensis]
MNAPLGDTPQDLTGLNVVDAEGAKVGSVQQVYRDDATNVPEWITVRTGLFGMKETFIPLAGARRVDDELHVPHTKDTIKEAPRIDADGHLDPSEEDELYRHYGLTRPGTTGGPTGADTGSPAGTPGTTGMKGTTGMAAGTAAGGAAGMAAGGTRRARAGERDRTMAEGERAARTDRPMAGAGGGMAMSRGRAEGEAAPTKETREQTPEIVLSEERIQIGTAEREAGRAHLRKHVVTEDVHRTVPLSHEEVRLVREKISDEEQMRGRTAPRLGDGEVEVVLHEEEAVVTKRTVPVERVRLETERVTEQREINTELRKEEVEFDDGMSTRKGDRKGPGPERRR